MEERDTSRTALGTAYLRAAHQLFDAPPRILEDPVAVPLLGAEAVRRLHERKQSLQAPGRLGLRSHVVLRSRFAEDRLEAAARRGASQYVILGAGFDTFAYRRRDVSDGGRVRVFEVDHPRTQAEKLRRVAQAGWPAPRGLVHVAVDFATEDLATSLRHAGLEPGLRTFFSWMGVTYYLERAAMEATFRALAALGAPGSTVVFDHLDDAAFDPERQTPRMRTTLELVARVGEPMKTGLAPAAMAACLRACGWEARAQLGRDELQARYFDRRGDGYRARDHFHVVSATSSSPS